MISYDHIYVCSLYQAVNDRLHWRCTACCLAVDLLPHVRMSQKWGPSTNCVALPKLTILPQIWVWSMLFQFAVIELQGDLSLGQTHGELALLWPRRLLLRLSPDGSLFKLVVIIVIVPEKRMWILKLMANLRFWVYFPSNPGILRARAFDPYLLPQWSSNCSNCQKNPRTHRRIHLHLRPPGSEKVKKRSLVKKKRPFPITLVMKRTTSSHWNTNLGL